MRLEPGSRLPGSANVLGHALCVVIGLIVAGATDSWVAGLVIWGIGAALVRWDARSLELDGQAEALRRLENRNLDIQADDKGTRVRGSLHADVPTMFSVGPGQGNLTGDPDFDAKVELVGDDAQWIGLLQADVRASLVWLIGSLRYDRAGHTLIVSAVDGASHLALGSLVDQAQALARRLGVLSRQSPVSRLRQRMHVTRGADRLPAFRAMWRADLRSTRALAEELTDPEIRYFIATASTPPDRETIEAMARDESLSGDLRTEAMLRWLGLSAGLRGDDLAAAFAALRAAPDQAPHASLLTDALQAWSASASTSGDALRLLGLYGGVAQVSVIGAQRSGPLAEAAQQSLNSLRARFPGLGSGHLAITTDDAGQLALAQDAPAVEAD